MSITTRSAIFLRQRARNRQDSGTSVKVREENSCKSEVPITASSSSEISARQKVVRQLSSNGMWIKESENVLFLVPSRFLKVGFAKWIDVAEGNMVPFGGDAIPRRDRHFHLVINHLMVLLVPAAACAETFNQLVRSLLELNVIRLRDSVERKLAWLDDFEVAGPHVGRDLFGMVMEFVEREIRIAVPFDE